MKLNTEQILALSTLKGIGNKKILKIADSFLVSKSINDFNEIVNKTLFAGKKANYFSDDDFIEAFDKARRIMDLSKKKGIGIISYNDEGFPESAKNAINTKGNLDPALILFYKGDFSLLKSDSVAIIGTRSASDVALRVARLMGREFAVRNFNIVSGLALGCDTAAHEGTLEVSGRKVIAILGNGLNNIYPKRNQKLADRIVESGGLLLSEYAPDIPAQPYNLVARDRLQTALSLGVVVIQSPTDGGSMHAARIAFKQNKPIFAVKFSDVSIDQSPKTLGNHELVNSYNAKYIGNYRNKIEMTHGLDEITVDLKSSHGNYNNSFRIQSYSLF